MTSNGFERALHAYLSRRAARDARPDTVTRVAEAAAERLTFHRRRPQLVPAILAVALPTALAAILTSALLIHARHTSARLATPMPSTGVVVPSLLPTPTFPVPTAAPPTAVPTPAPTPVDVIPVPGPSPWRGSPAMGTGPGLPMLLYGGNAPGTSGCEAMVDTDAWYGDHWYKLQATGPRLVTPTMGWDPITGHLLMVGAANTGSNGSQCWGYPTAAVQTWAWVPDVADIGGHWTRLTTRHAPPPSYTWGAFAFDAGHHRLVFEEFSQGVDTSHAEAWTWDGRDWTQAWSAGCGIQRPCPTMPSLVAEAPGGMVIGLGSSPSSGAPSVFTWTGSGWAATAIPGTPADPVLMVYDARIGRTLVIARTASLPSQQEALFWFDGRQWSSGTTIPTTLWGRNNAGFVAGSAGSAADFVLWGGETWGVSASPVIFNDTWIYDNSRAVWRKAAG